MLLMSCVWNEEAHMKSTENTNNNQSHLDVGLM